MKEFSIEGKAQAYDVNYKSYTELVNRLEDAKGAIKKQNYGIAMDILCKPYPEFQITTSTELHESKDEKIRKWLICTLKSLNNSPVQIDGAYEMMLPAIDWLKKQGEQKPTDIQSIEKRAYEVFPDDDDENTPLYRQAFIDGAIDYIDCGCKNTAWSEEDERISSNINLYIRKADDYPHFGKENIKEAKNWMNALKERYTWKPSDEQMAALLVAVGDEKKLGSDVSKELYELYLQLKQL